jgi:hypothetical protein
MTATLPAPPESRSPSRRALLAGALGGIGALAATVIGGAPRTQAAAGSPLIIGSQINDAGSADTQLLTNSSVIAFKLLQNGPGTALMGYATPATGGTRGVYGRSDSPDGDGVQARNAGTAGSGAAVRAFGGNNVGVVATSTSLTAVSGTSGSGYGVSGDSSSSVGVYGTSTSSYGVYGYSSSQAGVVGTSSSNTGVYGTSTSSRGVFGHSGSGYGVYGASDSGYAGVFGGPVYVTGLLTKAGGGFKIDHPLDPANQYLTHSFVESPDMKNVYDGLVTLDAGGEATVELPAYFTTLNRDLRYQLTPLGAFTPLYVKSEVAEGAFAIGGGSAGQRVCWQVTGIRQDPFAETHRIVAEEAKPAAERGRYLHPELYGQPTSKALHPRPEFAAGGVPTG